MAKIIAVLLGAVSLTLSGIAGHALHSMAPATGGAVPQMLLIAGGAVFVLLALCRPAR